MGTDWDPDEAAFVLNQWVRFGLARHPHFMKPAASPTPSPPWSSAPRGVHLNLVEVEPEAPRGGDRMIQERLLPRSPTSAPTGHLAELRVDPIGLLQRVRDECGDVGGSGSPTATS